MNFTTNPLNICGFGWGLFMMILFWAILIIGLITLIRWLIGQTQNKDQQKTSGDILKERYAKGEISKKEFRDKSREIKNL